ncbi:MAG: ABC transporter ATP-binding protein [Bacteroidia bacterium]|nr:ABC transporter ATP-binding protein [Bacteroidia bacterium]
MVTAKGIEKSYGALQVLKGIDLEIKAGEVVSIVGASGAGKSTLLHLLGTLDQPDQGIITVNGQEIQQLKGRRLAQFRNRHIGFIFQFHQLLPEFTAFENVCMPALIEGKSFEEAAERADQLLDLLGMMSRKEHKPSQLSGGEQQRIAIARALMNKPYLILADEPSGNLDSVNAKALHKLFFELREKLNQTFIIVTHNAELAEMADRKLTMTDGRISAVTSGSTGLA